MLDILLSCFVFTFFALPCVASPSDLGALEGFNSTKNLNTTFPDRSTIGMTNALGDLIGCFHQAPPQEPHKLSRTNFIDCFNAEKKIAAHDPHRPINFRRNDDTTFVLPNSFTYRTCVIFLDMVSADAEDVFYVGEIRDAAIDTARRCTALNQALGGKAVVGPKKLMEVLVLGRLWPWKNRAVDTVVLEGDNAID
ncbi:hypothetical protein HO173_000218 [Letharia columbiana]|uniref:Uncharacterized protein n=1 Tax=Letharia columbiana TaxID=112416 RepID=A0A8H6G6H6_9LECA|nr:uncharacterized protein HO173_000218 [Letharia columbiana]KAF6241508.1 hypothetical protein HO173_000218 [Letharia columbiana]